MIHKVKDNRGGIWQANLPRTDREFVKNGCKMVNSKVNGTQKFGLLLIIFALYQRLD